MVCDKLNTEVVFHRICKEEKQIENCYNDPWFSHIVIWQNSLILHLLCSIRIYMQQAQIRWNTEINK